WQRFAAILNLSRVKLAPVMLPVNTEQCAGVFSFQRQGHRGSSPRNIAPHRVAPAYR
ncbi:nucleoside efflux transporter ImpX, partial [Salmonella enterica]|nr:nucleoside efflux transporter ImpX [Salmonella enterica]